MSKVKITRDRIIVALETKSPKSLTEIYKILGGKGAVSGTVAAKMRELVPGIVDRLAENKAGTAKSERPVVPTKEKRLPKAGKKPAKATAKTNILRPPKNPFRPQSGYGLLLDIIASAKNGIGKEDLLKTYSKASGKDEQHAKYDLAVINSAREDSDKRHRSCALGFTIVKEGDCFRIRFG